MHAHRDDHAPEYIPAAGHDLFLPLYDPVLRLLMRENAFRQRFLAQADVQPGHHVLDVGCGTGTMALLIAERVPGAAITAVDGDPKALTLARAKAAKVGARIQFDEAFADRLPYPDQRFDRVLTSLVFHHLTHDQKLAALREIRRVLKPGGSFHFADFGPPVGWYARTLARLVVQGERLRESLDGVVKQLLAEAGFDQIRDCGHHGTLLGTLTLLTAR